MVYVRKGGYIKPVDESAVPKWKALGFIPMEKPETEKRKKSNGKDGE